MKHGYYTGQMGKQLYERYATSEHQIYYDHGQDKTQEPHYRIPEPFFGKCSTASTLSFPDITVVNASSRCVRLIAEIEEGKAEPKKVIGDIVNLMLADHVRIDGIDYVLNDLVFVLGIKVKGKGKGKEKVEAICQRLLEMNEKLGNRRISIIPVCHTDVERLVNEVEGEIDRWLSSLGNSR